MRELAMPLNAIDRTNPQKLYFQLLEILKGQIEQDTWKVGSQIPTEDQLCGMYNVSKATVRMAIAELVSLGYLKKFQGKGTFVRRRKPGDRIPMLLNLGEDHHPASIVRVLESRTLLPDDTVRDTLNIDDRRPCSFVSRIVLVEGMPLVLQKLYILSGVLPDDLTAEAIGSTPLHAFLESRCGIRIQRVKDMTDVTLVDEAAAVALELAPGMPVLRVRRICSAHGDEPVSFLEALCRTEVYARTLELERLRI
jgi:GntR family transcriptional regulator